MISVDWSMWKSSVWSTKPRLASTGPPISTGMWPTRSRRRIASVSLAMSSWISRSGMLRSETGLFKMMPIAPSAEWAQR